MFRLSISLWIILKQLNLYYSTIDNTIGEPNVLNPRVIAYP